MIKIDGNTFYLTGGDAGCRMINDGGVLRRVCFGKRGEAEDDMPTLIGAALPEVAASGALSLLRSGKAVRYGFVVKGAEVLGEKPRVKALPQLRGEKTLKVTLTDDKAKLGLELYYTPAPRGGMAERAVLINYGDTIEVVKARLGGVCIAATGLNIDRVISDEKSGACDRFVTLSEKTAGETHGEAFGLGVVYGGATVMNMLEHDGVTEAEFSYDFEKEPYTLECGERLCLPEVFAVYSDCGKGGLMRAVHDIVRESLMPEKYEGVRRPIVIFDHALADLDSADRKKLSTRAAIASKLGADTFLISLGIADPDDKKAAAAITKVKQVCDEAGIKLGVWTAFEHADVTAADLPRELLRKIGRGKFGFDFANPDTVELLYGKVKTLVTLGVNHLKWESDGGATGAPAASAFKYLGGVYTLFDRIVNDFPELTLEGGFGGDIDYGVLAYCGTVGAEPHAGISSALGKTGAAAVFPLCALGSFVEPAGENALPLKTRFDIASLGTLSYMAEITELGADIAAAVRAQVFSYQDDASLAVGGDVYRLKAIAQGDMGMLVASKDKSKAYAVYMSASGEGGRLRLRGLDEHNLYKVRELGKIFSGAALAYYGIPVPAVADKNISFTFHLGQVADYE